MGQSSGAASDDAVTLLRKGDFAGALSLADQALKQNPHDCRMLTVRGLALKNSGKLAGHSNPSGRQLSSAQSFYLRWKASPNYSTHSILRRLLLPSKKYLCCNRTTRLRT